MLADPVKRRTYDRSLRRSPRLAALPMTADDPATDELVLPAKELNAPAPETRSPGVGLPTDATLIGCTLATAPEPDAEGAERFIENPTQPDLIPIPNDNERASARNWGTATTVVACLGLALFFPLAGIQSSTSEERPAPGRTGPAGGAGLALVDRDPGNLSVVASNPGQPAALPADSPAKADGIGRHSGAIRANDEGTAKGPGDLAARDMADVPPGASSTPTRITHAAAAPSAPTKAAGARAISSTPPRPRAPAIAAAPVTMVGSTVIPVRTPAQWIGGGPTDADNRRGQYQGAVALQVSIDRRGRVSNCAAVRGSGDAGLDARTCRLFRKRARFAPALDAQGRPVVSQVYTTVVWSRSRVK